MKIDLLMETAMSSWSDNSSSGDVIKPKPCEPMEVDAKADPIVIDDSGDMKLVYEDTKTQSPGQGAERAGRGEGSESPASTNAPTGPASQESAFLKQAKVTDIKEPVALKAVQSPKAPRRVSFVTLSSPKNKKT